MPNRLFSASLRSLGATFIVGAFVVLHGHAMAWGADGHRLVAELAQQRLTPEAAAEANRLLALEPGATLASISTWADEFRSPSTAAWHYVNFGRETNCQYDAAPICIEGNCVVGAIARQVAILASNAPDEQRLKALKYLVHFIADVHQPLHAGYADDRGGNTYQLQAFGKGSNLHALWDSGLIQNWAEGAQALQASAQSAATTNNDDSNSPERWAEESCRIVATEDFYPDNRKVGEPYLQRWASVLAQRLGSAASRLANVLNRTLKSQ